jgi:hypothetical protein
MLGSDYVIDYRGKVYKSRYWAENETFESIEKNMCEIYIKRNK